MRRKKEDAELVEIRGVTIVGSNERAGLFEIHNGDRVWIPWDNVAQGSIERDGETGSIFIPSWLASSKGLH